MKKTNNEGIWRSILFSLMSIMLVFSAISPSLAVAASETVTEVTLDKNFTTVHEINGGDVDPEVDADADADAEVVLTLRLDNGNEWAHDIDENAEKKNILISKITADQENEKWEEYKEDIKMNVLDDKKELTLTLPKDKKYEIEQNQNITININPTLMEKWPGEVTPVNFTIYAKPQITLGGTIIKDTTLEDIKNGGKVIELQLVNAKWNKEHIQKKTNFNTLLNNFIATHANPNPNPVVWDIATALQNTDPNKAISYSEDKRTLKIKLPAVSSNYFGDVELKVLTEFYTVEKVNAEGVLSDFGTSLIAGDTIAGDTKKFKIGTQATPGMSPIDVLEEENLKKEQPEISLPILPDLPTSLPSPKLKLELKNAVWTPTFTDETKLLLLDSIQPKDQKEQWELIKEKMLTNNFYTGSITRDSKSTVTIAFPEVKDLYLEKDMNLSLNIPYQLLKNDVKIPVQQFIIKAQPKVLLTGTAFPVISQTDFSNGGKTIILSLVNTTWEDNVGTNATKRNHLLNAFTWGDFENVVLARADVQRTNDSTVTIELPAISQKYSGDIKFESSKLVSEDETKKLLKKNTSFLNKDHKLVVEPVTNQKAKVTGTATNKINDLDIIKGEKTVIISLENDKWIADLMSDTNKNKIKLSVGNINELTYEIIRTNDTTATLTLAADSGFKLTEDQNVEITIPEDILSIRSTKDKPLKIDSAFKIAAVTATLSGNGILLEPIDVQKGSKSVVVTLNNAEFKDDFKAEDLKEMFSSTIISVPWKFTDSDFKVSKNKITIKFPAVSDYSDLETRNFNINIKGSMLKDYSETAATMDKVITAGEVSIGGTASATVNQTSLKESEIQSGGSSLSIKLLNAEWDDSIATNASKKTALLRGFAVTDQTKEWGVATSVIAKEGEFSVSGSILTIKLPKNPDYSIVRQQSIVLTVPKSVLKNYKYDIPVKQNLLITVPTVQSPESFSGVLESGLLEYIEQNKMENIRVEVPKKAIQKISTYAAQLGNNTITTIEVETGVSVKKIGLTIQSEKGKIVKEPIEGKNNKFTFILNDVQSDSTLMLEAFDASDNKVGSSFNKMAKGNKVFTEVPKISLEGNYSLYSLLTDKSLLSNIQKYYSLDDLKIGIIK